jgi:hypothetical protein
MKYRQPYVKQASRWWATITDKSTSETTNATSFGLAAYPRIGLITADIPEAEDQDIVQDIT